MDILLGPGVYINLFLTQCAKPWASLRGFPRLVIQAPVIHRRSQANINLPHLLELHVSQPVPAEVVELQWSHGFHPPKSLLQHLTSKPLDLNQQTDQCWAARPKKLVFLQVPHLPKTGGTRCFVPRGWTDFLLPLPSSQRLSLKEVVDTRREVITCSGWSMARFSFPRWKGMFLITSGL